jgi:hypothetical protein
LVRGKKLPSLASEEVDLESAFMAGQHGER